MGRHILTREISKQHIAVPNDLRLTSARPPVDSLPPVVAAQFVDLSTNVPDRLCDICQALPSPQNEHRVSLMSLKDQFMPECESVL